jgi:hypothetical protein
VYAGRHIAAVRTMSLRDAPTRLIDRSVERERLLVISSQRLPRTLALAEVGDVARGRVAEVLF